MSEQETFAQILNDTPFDPVDAPFEWVRWVLFEGYERRMHGGTLHGMMIDHLAGLAGKRSVVSEIGDERLRQVAEEGWTPEHDDGQDCGELARASAAYAINASWPYYGGDDDDYPGFAFWPWESGTWRPTERRRDLIKAGALIVAEIERLDRAQPGGSAPQPADASEAVVPAELKGGGQQE